MKRYALAACGAALFLAGCVSEPKTPEEFISKCTKRFAGMDSEAVTELSRATRTSRQKAPEVACQRILVAAQKGRIASKDTVNLDKSSSPIWKVLKGQ